MKTKLLNVVTAACLLLLPFLTFGQTMRPTMGTTENFVLFTTDGALTNIGASQLTLLTGDVGSNTAATITNLGNIDGNIYATGDGEGVTAQAAADLVDLYNELYGLAQEYALPVLLGGPDHFPPGIYANAEVTTLDGNLILDANDDPDALFIFIIKAPGTFATTANSSIELLNGAQACNVFWLVEGTVGISTGNTLKGTFVSAAAISFASETAFEGRALTKVGAITINNNEIGFLAQKPIGCGSLVLTGPMAPELATAGCFALFTGNGSLGNSGVSTIVGDVGSNTASPTGFELPTTVDGTVHLIPNAETAQANLDLSDAFDYLVALPHDIELLSPVLFGHNLILTPHTYVLAAETHLTGDLYLDAQGNPDAVFVIKVDAAFFTAVDSRVILINDAKAENVYWKVTGAVSIEVGSIFEGTIILTGAVELKSAAAINGRVLTKTGDFSTVAITAISPGCGSPTAPDITTQPTDQTGCVGGSASFTVVATGTDLTYQWRKGTVELSDLTDNISGATTATLTIDPISLADEANNYNVVVTGSVDPFTVISDNASLTVSSPPEITLQPENQTTCLGGSVSFTVEATGDGLTYQWRKGLIALDDITANISGATTSTLTINPVELADVATDYNVVITGDCEPNAISDNAELAIGAAAEITSQPINQTACEGGIASFTVVATGTDLTYQWRKGTVNLSDLTANISGATSATLTIDPVSLGDAANDYNVVVSGTCEPSVTSNNATLTVSAAPEIEIQPSDQVACIGGIAQFSVAATGAGITVQWYKGEVPLTNSGNISGATSATLIINPVGLADEAINYNVVVSGLCGSVTSNYVSLTVFNAPEITLQPVDQTACLGGSASFTVEADGPNLSYQWRKGTVVLTNGGNISGATTATLTINPVALSDVADNYNVVITGCDLVVTSENASLVVGTPIEITSQPVNQTVCDGDNVSFSVTATGTITGYQWRKGSVNLVNAGNISGVNTATLTIVSVTTADAATNYNVVISGGCGTPVTSNNASLTVNTPPVITVQPTNQGSCDGSAVSFTVVATGTNLTYQWRKGGVPLTNAGNISGATSATLTINPVSESDVAPDYDVVISGTCGLPLASNNAALVMDIVTEITFQPVDLNVNEGDDASFSVTAIGTDLMYQWRKGTVALTNGGNISGATTHTITFSPVTSADIADNYNVVVTGSCGPAVTSDYAALNVFPTGIDIVDSGNAITIYPNPFNVSLNIKLNDALQGNKFEFVIYNILGEMVMKTAITDQITTIETGAFLSGIYFYQLLENSKTIQSGKMIKQK